MPPPPGLATAMAPPFSLVLRHFSVAGVSFLLLALLLLLQAPILASGTYLHPRVLAMAHLAGLGWVCLTMMGALYQLVPVVLEVPLWSIRLGRATFWVYLAGFSGLVGHMWMGASGPGLWMAGGLAVLGLGLFALNLVQTLRQASRWDLTAWHLLAAVASLAVAALLGLGLAVHLWHPWLLAAHTTFLPLHAHLALGGWVSLVVMGVSYKLIPMFNLAHGYSMGPGRWALAGVTIGLGLWTLGALLPQAGILIRVGQLALGLGMALFLIQMAMIHRKRLRRRLDVGLQHAAVAWGFLVVTLVLGILAAWGARGAMAYGVAAFLGYVSLLMVGMLYKIVPFLAWFHRYSDRVGKEPVPMLQDMYSEPLARGQLRLLTASVAILIPGLLEGNPQWVTVALAGLVVSAGLFGYNMLRVFLHRPRI